MNDSDRNHPAADSAADAAPPRIRYVACPLCESADIPFLLEANCTKHPLYQPALPPTMRWHRCASCQHVFTEGHFTPAMADIVFARTHDKQRLGYDFHAQRQISARMVDKVARHISAGNWLDVGFGNGSLLFTAEEFGFRVVGLDLRRDNVEQLRRAGFAAHCAAIEDIETKESFAVISMADVLEHMPFPKKGLNAARRLLQAGGALFLSMPNMGCSAWRALGPAEGNPYWFEIEHYHNFSRARLFALLEEHGFAPVAYGVSERYHACMEVIAIRRD